MLDALEDGYNVALTADVPKVSRVAGLGIVKLAQHSGRPIYPVAIATQPPHRARQLGPRRDQSAVQPHGAGGERADPRRRAMPTTRRWKRRGCEVENALNAATARAYAIVDGRGARTP